MKLFKRNTQNKDRFVLRKRVKQNDKTERKRICIKKEKLLELRDRSYLSACDLKLIVKTDIDTVAFYMGQTNNSSDLIYSGDVLYTSRYSNCK